MFQYSIGCQNKNQYKILTLDYILTGNIVAYLEEINSLDIIDWLYEEYVSPEAEPGGTFYIFNIVGNYIVTVFIKGLMLKIKLHE